MSHNNKLAIFGGEPAIPPGTIQSWPPITEVDEQYVLASLRGGKHTFGPNCVAFEKEFAAWKDPARRMNRKGRDHHAFRNKADWVWGESKKGNTYLAAW